MIDLFYWYGDEADDLIVNAPGTSSYTKNSNHITFTGGDSYTDRPSLVVPRSGADYFILFAMVEPIPSPPAVTGFYLTPTDTQQPTALLDMFAYAFVRVEDPYDYLNAEPEVDDVAVLYGARWHSPTASNYVACAFSNDSDASVNIYGFGGLRL